MAAVADMFRQPHTLRLHKMPRADKKSYPLEAKRRLSQSLLWRLQRNYFEQHGINAWSSGTVPHHITSSPFIADAYARVVIGFLRDWTTLDLSQPVYIVELGSGSGRFAYLFLKKFLNHCRSSVLKEIRVKYVMTDFTQRNLEYWRTHLWFEPFIKEGSLDLARFDLETDVEINLHDSGDVLSAATLRNPLVVISNYVFDSTPQDAFLAADNNLFEILVSLNSSQKESDTNDPDILSRVELSDHCNQVAADYYDDANWNHILQVYKERFSDTPFLFPTAALNCIRNLHRLSNGRLLLLSGDRGYNHDDALRLGLGAPTMAVHGSFSMMVDYQIIGEYSRILGGTVLHPSRHTDHLNVSAFLFGDSPNEFVETTHAYNEAIEKFGPDDFFTLKQGFTEVYEGLKLDEILAFLRLSCWDYKRFFECLPALKKHLADMTGHQKQQLHAAIVNVWDSYLPIGEDLDLAFELGTLLLEIERHEEALKYLQYSLDLHGPAPGTEYNIAVCYFSLGQTREAQAYLERALELDPDFEEAIALAVQLSPPVPKTVP